jgi:FkbM family methyltransferase
MLTKLVRIIRREAYYPLKRLAKSLLKNHVYVARHGLARGFKVTGDLGFLAKPAVEYEDDFIARLDLAGHTVYDIGGHIGLITLYFSRAVGPTGRVITFEPNPETYAILNKNIAVNRLTNVQTINFGLGAQPQTLELLYGDYDGGLGTLDKTRQQQIVNSHRGMTVKTSRVPVYPLDDLIAQQALPDPTFVKIDVEEFEYPVLLGMRATLERAHPAVLVELHGATHPLLLENTRRIVDYLSGLGYHLSEITHGETITLHNLNAALAGMALYGRWGHHD